MRYALFGLHRGPSIEPDTIGRLARLAEDAGFEALWVGDHVALPRDLPGSGLPRLEALIALAYLAAATSRIRLGVGVIVLPQRQPVLLAKQLTSIDVLSGGRLTVGIGVGYVEAELRAMGASLASRGARADEYIEVLRAAWRESTHEFHGRFVSFGDVVQSPLPVQRPHPPIVIGGSSAAAYRRAVRYGNGWYGWELDPTQTAQAIADLEETAKRHPRPTELGDLEISITPPGAIDLETARRYAEAGVDRLVLQPEAMGAAEMRDLITKAGTSLIGRA